MLGRGLRLLNVIAYIYTWHKIYKRRSISVNSTMEPQYAQEMGAISMRGMCICHRIKWSMTLCACNKQFLKAGRSYARPVFTSGCPCVRTSAANQYFQLRHVKEAQRMHIATQDEPGKLLHRSAAFSSTGLSGNHFWMWTYMGSIGNCWPWLWMICSLIQLMQL